MQELIIFLLTMTNPTSINDGTPYGKTDVFVGVPTDLEAVESNEGNNESKPTREELLKLQQNTTELSTWRKLYLLSRVWCLSLSS